MAVNVPFLEQVYFAFDKPVPYKLNDKTIEIRPVNLVDSEIFMTSVGLLTIDKNSWPSAEVIQMSYLDFIIKVLFQEEQGEINKQRLVNILKLCLDMNNPSIYYDDNNIPHLLEIINDKIEFDIPSKQFDEIKRIILYQNIPDYDDDYINPEIKMAMADVDELKNRDIEMPSTERKIAIVTSHTGLSKKQQLEMTYRSHELLFKEVCGEIEYTTTRAIALYTGQADKIEHWIFKKKKDKFDGYFTSTNKFNKSMGGNGKVATVTDVNDFKHFDI